MTALNLMPPVVPVVTTDLKTFVSSVVIKRGLCGMLAWVASTSGLLLTFTTASMAPRNFLGATFYTNVPFAPVLNYIALAEVA